VRRLLIRVTGLVAFVGFTGLLGTDVLSGITSNHNETLLRDTD
jgi:hypothetical protein